MGLDEKPLTDYERERDAAADEYAKLFISTNTDYCRGDFKRGADWATERAKGDSEYKNCPLCGHETKKVEYTYDVAMKGPKPFDVVCLNSDCGHTYMPNKVESHIREFELIKRSKDLSAAHEAIRGLAGALEKYGNTQNWRYSSNNDVGAHDAWLDFKPGHYSKVTRDLGIYIAKEALTKHAAIIERAKGEVE